MAGAANVATLRLLVACGVDFGNVYACDSRGILHPGRDDISRRKLEYIDKWRICENSNAEGRRGGPDEAMRARPALLAR